MQEREEGDAKLEEGECAFANPPLEIRQRGWRMLRVAVQLRCVQEENSTVKAGNQR